VLFVSSTKGQLSSAAVIKRVLSNSSFSTDEAQLKNKNVDLTAFLVFSFFIQNYLFLAGGQHKKPFNAPAHHMDLIIISWFVIINALILIGSVSCIHI